MDIYYHFEHCTQGNNTNNSSVSCNTVLPGHNTIVFNRYSELFPVKGVE